MPGKGRARAMKPDVSEAVNTALQRMRRISGFEHVRFIILHGSAAEGRATRESDIDLCMYYDGNRTEAARFRHRVLSALTDPRFDIQVFQQLPLYVRVGVLKGTPVFVSTPEFLYETATRTLRDFDDFKHRLYDYTGQAAIR